MVRAIWSFSTNGRYRRRPAQLQLRISLIYQKVSTGSEDARRHDELESQIFRSRRYLERNERLTDFDKSLLNFLRRLPGTSAREKLQAKFRSMLKEAYSLSSKNANNHILGLEEIICWLESRINRSTIVAEFRAKLRKRCNPDKS